MSSIVAVSPLTRPFTQHHTVPLNHVLEALGNVVPVQHVYPHGQASTPRRLPSSDSTLSSGSGPVADNGKVEVGVVPGGPGRPGAERPHLALGHVLGKDALDDREMVAGLRSIAPVTPRARPSLVLHSLIASLMKAGMVLMALAAFIFVVVVRGVDARLRIELPLVSASRQQTVLIGNPQDRPGAIGNLSDTEHLDEVSPQHLPESVVAGLETLNDRLSHAFVHIRWEGRGQLKQMLVLRFQILQ